MRIRPANYSENKTIQEYPGKEKGIFIYAIVIIILDSSLKQN